MAVWEEISDPDEAIEAENAHNGYKDLKYDQNGLKDKVEFEFTFVFAESSQTWMSYEVPL